MVPPAELHPVKQQTTELTQEALAAHEGQQILETEAMTDDVDRTLDATRNSNSFDVGTIAESFPNTTIDSGLPTQEEEGKVDETPQ